VVATAALCFHVPASIPLSAASTLPLGITTTAQAFYQSLRLPRPFSVESKVLDTDSTKSVLIYGAGTATGALAVQLAKLSGMHVVAICSPKIKPWIKSLGANAIFDYVRNPGWVQHKPSALIIMR
jgi:NADPH:quinone reductase-like Zn-dependent oxidoreductase